MINNILKVLHNDLERYKNFEQNDNADKFLNTIDQIVSFQDPQSIPVIIGYFDDQSEYSWVLESMSKAIEHFNKIAYVPTLLKNINLFELRAQEWATILFFRILNDPTYLSLFSQNMHLAPKESLLKLFDLMEEESPHHVEIIKELRTELEKSHP